MTVEATFGRYDGLTFGAYLLGISLIGWFAGRKQRDDTEAYFLADRSLPWYVVGCSFIAANISTEHFIGMVGAAVIYGICVATPEWSSVIAFTFLIWLFIPFLLSARVFTTPEYLERRFTRTLRVFFAIVTILVNIFGFLAPVLYGGGLALDRAVGFSEWWSRFASGTALGRFSGDGLDVAIAIIGLVAGLWAVWGGLKSVVWMDVLTVVVKIGGGLLVSWFGLLALSGNAHSLRTGFSLMIERNQATYGVWHQAVQHVLPYILPGHAAYDRLSVIQPLTHETTPWTHWVLSFFYIGLWYTVINQFMIQRVLAARSLFDARMGIVLAAFLKLLLPFVVVLPGLIFFALHPEILLAPDFASIRPEADRTYIKMIAEFIPTGLKGVLCAALFGAIQSTVSAVLNATSTIVTVDLVRRFVRPAMGEHQSVRFGRLVTVVTLLGSIVTAFYIQSLHASLFVYIQALFTFFAPPFSAVFLLGSLWRRVGGSAATITVFVGFLFGLAVKVWENSGSGPAWLLPFSNQGALNWAVCMILCAGLTSFGRAPEVHQVTSDLTIQWGQLFRSDGFTHGATTVAIWWAASLIGMLAFVVIFGLIF